MLVTKKSQRVRYVKMFYVKKEKKKEKRASEMQTKKNWFVTQFFFFFLSCLAFHLALAAIRAKISSISRGVLEGGWGRGVPVLVREMQC